ncbi:cdc42 effector protein 1 isoform 2-T2 [Pelodytes ibericus]
MNLGSLPVIKNLVSRSKRERRVELTTDMISPPLGDFRHTVHVGRKGEVFGDASFLSKYQVKHRHNRWTRFTKNLRHTGWVSSGQPNTGDPIYPPPALSPIIKNAVSLPLLSNHNWDDDRDEDTDWSSVTQSPSGFHSGFCTLPRHSSSQEQPENTSYQIPREEWVSADYTVVKESSVCTESLDASSSLWHSDSMESMVMDFGPSLMSEIMNKISFSDGPTESPNLSVTNEQDVLPSNTHSILSTAMDNNKWEPSESQISVQEPKGFASWDQVNINEEMELEVKEDMHVSNTEHGYRRITEELWDTDDGSEVEM